MQFSLRWILAATAYVAIATFAFTQADWISADFLWAMSLLAVVYAALLASFARGNRQVKAAGFVFASAGFLLCLYFGGAYVVPTSRLLYAAGMGSQPVQLINPFVSSGTPTGSDIFVHSLAAGASPAVDHYLIYSRAANAVAFMAFGLLGCLVGAMAFRVAAVKAGA